MSSQNNIMETILSSTRTVFTTQSLRMLSGSNDSTKLNKSLHYYAKDGRIRNIRKGIYTKKDYDEKEMACCLYRPAYISLEYVLQRSGIVFQYDDTVTCVSYLNRDVETDGKKYRYRIIKPELWAGLEGIEQKDNIYIASPEKAVLDMMYLSAGNCCFDNLHPINKTKISQLLPLYNSDVLTERMTKLLKL